MELTWSTCWGEEQAVHGAFLLSVAGESSFRADGEDSSLGSPHPKWD